MKICVTATGDDMSSEVDPRFGRCAYFIVVDTESMEFEAVSNESAVAAGGAGIQAAQTVADLGVQAVLTGNVGPNAFSTLDAAGVTVYTGLSGTVKEAVERFKSGEIEESQGPTTPPHSGVGGGGGGRGRRR
ncbi:MAG: NifB/NifX family molybdenum-iron cluster-binding protein [Methanomassiliicoccales archaeon]